MNNTDAARILSQMAVILRKLPEICHGLGEDSASEARIPEACERGAQALRDLAHASICPHEGEARCPLILP